MRRVFWLVLLMGCGNADTLSRESVAIDGVLKDARAHGAYDCAPQELARGEANVEFARYELEHGNLLRATKHMAVARAEADRAAQLSDSEQCNRVIIPDDRDGDRLADGNDTCPDEAEDRDGFQDDDGCPERDNDGDAIDDAKDKCPMEAGDAKHDGCPANDRDDDGISDAVDQCPDIPEDIDHVSDHDGCPEQERGDRDTDGITDTLDRCPAEAEDRDGYQDSDGCPDPDNDGDTVLDIADKCPMDAGPPANDGCPNGSKPMTRPKKKGTR